LSAARSLNWLLISSLSALLCLVSPPLSARSVPPWSKAKTPSEGTAQSLGFYSEGCLRAGVALEARAPGLRSVRRSRNRYYGHPELLATLYQIGEELEAEGLKPALVGDLSQPRGGLMTFGHKSHQSGLDADIWFGVSLKGKSAVMGREERLNPKVWSARHESLLRIAAQQRLVERIFVHWRIKAELCQRSEPPAWIRKLRPWFGHDKHFHIRLSCPKDSEACEAQEPLPEGLGCEPEHLKWFSALEARARRLKGGEEKPPLTEAEREQKRAAAKARRERSARRAALCQPLSPKR